MQFTNPWGFLALLGIPAILLIHFLQRRERPAVVTTLFLLESLKLESRKGNRFQKLITSPPMWLQLLGVLLVTWLLTAPKFIASDRSQRIALVMDSSASMSSFKNQVDQRISEMISDGDATEGRIELLVIEDDLSRAPIYRGNSLDDLSTALTTWQPGGSARSPEQALRSARHALGDDAQLIYLTDHSYDSPSYGAGVLAIGEPIDNVGLSGIDFGEAGKWQAIVRNFSASPQTREWWISYPDGSRTQPASVSLNPNSAVVLSAPLPEGIDRFTIQLRTDAFAFDDVLPVVTPEPKTLNFATELKEEDGRIARKILGALPGLSPITEEPDLWVANIAEGVSGDGMKTAAILFSSAPTLKQYLDGPVTSIQHPLVDGLNWEALAPLQLAQPLKAEPSDLVLVWKGEVPLIILKGEGTTQALVFNFDISKSAFRNQPASLILIHRFCQSVRRDLRRYHRINLECREAIELPPLPDGSEVKSVYQAIGQAPVEKVLTPSERATLAAPDQPGFFSILVDGEPLLDSALHFADLREADFSDARSEQEMPANSEAERRKTLQQDPTRQIWALVLIGTLLGSWAWIK